MVKSDKEKLIEKKISEYIKLEKYFGTDRKGNIIYDEIRDQNLALDNLERRELYSGFNSFLEWIDGKTKAELEQDLINIHLNSDQDSDKKPEQGLVQKVIYPSNEQKAIIESVSTGKNTAVDAVAGSGKTTTVMFLAQKNPTKKILQITYNKELKLEVREKVECAGITNIDIHTYHSLAVRFYDKECYTDDKIIKVLSQNLAPKVIKKYDILIVDEVQDMTPNYFSLVCKFINDMKLQDSTLLILGDRYQGVYEFKNADTRFLVYADKIFSGSNNFVKLPMQESYRVTEQIAWFVNKVMLGQDRIVSNKKGAHKVYFWRKNRFSVFASLGQKILELIKQGYKPSDFFVLAPSLKSASNNNPIKKLENKLVGMKIPVYFSRNDEEGLDREIIKGKIVFTTFHQAKGRERKVCIVFGFDSSYFKFYKKDKDPHECPSELYVAITRASEVLIIFEGDDELPLEFLKMDHNTMKNSGMVAFDGTLPKDIKEKTLPMEDIHKTSVTELTSYISEENNEKLIDLLAPIFETKCTEQAKYTVDIPSSIKTSNGKTEDVSDINGLVIPAMYEHEKVGVSQLQNMINTMHEDSNAVTKKLIDDVLNKKIDKKDSISKFLCMGNLYIALNEKIHSKLEQIDSYKWLTKDMTKVCFKNLKNNVGKEPEFEFPLGNYENDDGSKIFRYVTNSFGEIELTSRTDCIDKKTLWEFKCVSSLSNEHLLQLVVYAWIWEKCMKDKYGKKKFKILNIRTGEVKALKYDNFHIEEIISVLLQNKYYKKPKDNDKDFIDRCNKVRIKISSSVNKPLERSLFEFGFDNGPDLHENSDDDMSFGEVFGKKKKTVVEKKPKKEKIEKVENKKVTKVTKKSK